MKILAPPNHGRTSLMMWKAMRAAEAGKKTMVVTATEKHAADLRKQYRHKNLTIMSVDAWNQPQARRGRRVTVVMYDHYIFERQP